MPRVLYIEDNGDNRMLVRRILMASDYDLSVQEAEQRAEGDRDRTGAAARPDPDGFEYAGYGWPDGDAADPQLSPTLRQFPIVALTANAMDSDRERSLEAGCDGYIKKPIDVDKFPDEVIHFLRSRNERRSNQQQSADAD